MRFASNTQEGRNTIMCNFCNSSTNVSTCNQSSGCSSTCNSWWSHYQSICRDCCGNIHVRKCPCNRCNTCNTCNSCEQSNCGCGCGSNNNSYTPNTNGNVGVAYLSYCGNGNATNTSSGDLYYARQYGLLGSSSCPCSVGYNYTQTT